jgi:hypothetical protein
MLRLFGRNVFGFWLPYVGFVSVAVNQYGEPIQKQDEDFDWSNRHDPHFVENYLNYHGYEWKWATMFTAEWLDRGISAVRCNYYEQDEEEEQDEHHQ